MSTRVIVGDARTALRQLPDDSVHCCITSPPYWSLRTYEGGAGMIGLEPTFQDHLATLVDVFREVRRVMRPDATLWLNYGDAYDSKQLQLMPAKVAMALQDDGWWLRSEIIWHKPNPMPDSVRDRPTSAHDKIFLLSPSARYFYDADAVRTPSNRMTAYPDGRHPQNQPTGWVTSPRYHDNNPGRPPETGKNMMPVVAGGANLRNVWKISAAPYKGTHFATFPTQLVEPCIQAGTSQMGVCTNCGAPWERVAQASYRKHRPSAGNDPRSRSEDKQAQGSLTGKHGWKGNNLLRDTNTLGWRPTCSCYDDLYRSDDQAYPAPKTARKRHQRAAWDGRWWRVRRRPGRVQWARARAVVLDPFAGAGTTGLVADRLGRDSILVEISPKYAKMARDRIEGDAPLFTDASLQEG